MSVSFWDRARLSSLLTFIFLGLLIANFQNCGSGFQTQKGVGLVNDFSISDINELVDNPLCGKDWGAQVNRIADGLDQFKSGNYQSESSAASALDQFVDDGGGYNRMIAEIDQILNGIVQCTAGAEIEALTSVKRMLESVRDRAIIYKIHVYPRVGSVDIQVDSGEVASNTFQIRNEGIAKIQILDISHSNPAPAFNYEIKFNSNCNSSGGTLAGILNSGSSCSSEVTFDATNMGIGEIGTAGDIAFEFVFENSKFQRYNVQRNAHVGINVKILRPEIQEVEDEETPRVTSFSTNMRYAEPGDRVAYTWRTQGIDRSTMDGEFTASGPSECDEPNPKSWKPDFSRDSTSDVIASFQIGCEYTIKIWGYSPSGVKSASKTVKVTVVDPEDDSPSGETILIPGIPVIKISASGKRDYSEIKEGSSLSGLGERVLNLLNEGDGPANIRIAKVETSYFSITEDCSTLEPGEICTITMKPNGSVTNGSKSGGVNISWSSPDPSVEFGSGTRRERISVWVYSRDCESSGVSDLNTSGGTHSWAVYGKPSANIDVECRDNQSGSTSKVGVSHSVDGTFSVPNCPMSVVVQRNVSFFLEDGRYENCDLDTSGDW